MFSIPTGRYSNQDGTLKESPRGIFSSSRVRDFLAWAARRAGLSVYECPRARVLSTVVVLMDDTRSTVVVNYYGSSFPDGECFGETSVRSTARYGLESYTSISLPEEMFNLADIRSGEPAGDINHLWYVLVPEDMKDSVVAQMERGNKECIRCAGGVINAWDVRIASTEALLNSPHFKQRDLLLAALAKAREDGNAALATD